ncbi:uncharacterized protein LOC108023418 [Drosophila biarmipes]|uniref:uncharacterized protein LOC108023418 n=1 Tax=Drosophila biarmipes TaxID=125945 RepID=UPI0007E63661|nr:uncharacterized protein LOC108023418 [Drosophila biarmipes]
MSRTQRQERQGRQEDLEHLKSLHLLDKTLPISVATAPELRSRRQFSFNGLRYEMSGLPRTPPPLQMQLSRLRAGGGGGGSQGKMQTHGSGHSIAAKPVVESAGGDHQGGGGAASGAAGVPRPDQKAVLPKRVSIGDRALLMNGGVRMPRRCEMDSSKEKPTAAQRSSSTEWQHKKEEKQKQESLRRERKHRRRQQQSQELEKRRSSPEVETSPGLTSQQSWMLAQSLLKAYGSGLVHPAAGEGASSKMDYITLSGLVLGCVASHALFFLCWYFSWLKAQAVGLRKRFLGNANLWEFFDLEDTSRYSVQTKLVLAPLILVCGLLYCVVNMLHLVVQVVRSDVPRTVVVFVQRVANSGLLGTITMGLAGGGGQGVRGGRQKPAIQ